MASKAQKRYASLDPDFATFLEEVLDEDLSDSSPETVLIVGLIKEKARLYFGGEVIDHRILAERIDALQEYYIAQPEPPDPRLAKLIANIAASARRESAKGKLFDELLRAIESKRKLDESNVKRDTLLMKMMPIDQVRFIVSKLTRAVNKHVKSIDERKAVFSELSGNVDGSPALGDGGPAGLPAADPS